MSISSERILTTHVGSLPRSSELLGLLVKLEKGETVDRGEFRRSLAAGLDHVVARQLQAGIDIGGDGELPRIGFSTYVKDRMTGFGGTAHRGGTGDLEKFPDYAALKMATVAGFEELGESASLYPIPEAQDKVAYDPQLTSAKEELEQFRVALDRADGTFTGTFVTAASPGIVSTTMRRAADHPAYADDREYVRDLARELKREYEYVASQGHTLQIDAPDLAGERGLMFKDRPIEEFVERIRWHIEALNEAIADIPREQTRMHVCWGNWDGPHVDDVALEAVLPTIYEANVGALLLPMANPAHAHEYKLFAKYPPPDPITVIPGVIDVTYNYLEHPEVVADRICQVADAIGDPSRVMAGTDCGFGTFAGYVLVAEDVAWTKLERLAEGAAIATKRLGG